ncbi:MAG: efflux RND transporter permease subunit [Patescibacteria group bacterium]|nr:efflux RND transporter permease subunit [Patescibacteria group bacterium]
MGPRNKVISFIFNNIQIVALLFVFLVVAGAAAFFNLRREGFPDIPVNVAIVSVTYPGASALQVEDQVLKPLENGLDGVDSIEEYETVANNSFAVGIVTLDAKADLDKAIDDINIAMDSVKLPEDAGDINVSKISTGSSDFFIGLTGIENDWELYHQGKKLVEQIETTDGIKSAVITNPITPRVVIEFDQNKLQQTGITRDQVESILKAAQLDVPAGSFYDEDESRVNVGLSKQISSPYEVAGIKITPDLTIDDLATVWVDLDNNDYFNRIGYRPDGNNDEDILVERSLLISVTVQDDADLIKTAANLDETYDEFLKDLPKEVEIINLFSQADFTQQQLDQIYAGVFGRYIDSLGPAGVIGYLFGGVILVTLLLLIFINFRVALMAALSIPLALGATSIWLVLSGVALNTLVLFSMILVIGLVVDPTIVFLESVQRHIEQGYSGREAAAKTFNTVGWGVALAVITNFLVFIPFGIISGFFGEIIKFIPLTVVPAIISSFIIPMLFFLPIGAKFFKRSRHLSNTKVSELTGTWNISKWIGRRVYTLLSPTMGMKVLRVFIVVVASILPLVVTAGIMSSGAVKVVQFASDEEPMYIDILGEIDSSWSFEKSVTEVAIPVQDILRQQPEISNFGYFYDESMLLLQQGGNSFTIFANLIPAEERDEDMRTGQELIDDLNNYFAKLKGAKIEAMAEGAGPPEDRYPVRVQIFDSDQTKLEEIGADVAEWLNDQDDVKEVVNSLDSEAKSGNISFVLAQDNLANQNPFMAMAAIQNRLSERDITEVTIGSETFSIQSRLLPELTNLDQVQDIPVIVTPRGEVKIRDLVENTIVAQDLAVQRVNGRRYVDIKAQIEDDADPLALQTELLDWLKNEKLDEYDLTEDDLASRGDLESIDQSFTDLFVTLIVAIFMIYVLLVAFFRSLLAPIIILFAIPLGLIGVMPAILLTTAQLGFLELLGVVVMAGIVVNVTILLIDFANQMRKEGYTLREAMATATAVRFRPIFLTQATAFGSLIPLAVYAPFWRGMASVIVAGIIFSALLSLVTTPILYLWTESVLAWFSRWGKRLMGNGF